jgi:uncharacterized protein YjbI with pentapeptide repeats
LLNLAHLESANLIKTHLEGAFLPQAKLRAALVKEADFANARLERADFERALIEDTRFEGARFGAAVTEDALVDGVDLSTTVELTQEQVETMWGRRENLTTADNSAPRE